MAASFNDAFILGNNSVFVGRVQSSMLAACIAIANEGNVADHHVRLHQVHQTLTSPTTMTAAAAQFALTVATDATVLADATQNGTVVLTTGPGNVPTQQALVTDAHITTAVSAHFNAFCQGRTA